MRGRVLTERGEGLVGVRVSAAGLLGQGFTLTRYGEQGHSGRLKGQRSQLRVLRDKASFSPGTGVKVAVARPLGKGCVLTRYRGQAISCGISRSRLHSPGTRVKASAAGLLG